MADFATPSAAAISSLDAGAEASTNGTSTPAASKPAGRPEKPDESVFKAAVEKARKALNDAQEYAKTAQAKVNAGRPGKDSPAAKRREELRSQLNDIKTKQQGFKSTRNVTQDKIKALDTQLKSRIQEQKNAKSKIPYKSAEDIDREIARVQKEVDTGRMKLVDEKKALGEITTLNRQRKAFAGFDEAEKSINDIKGQIAALKTELDNPEYKSLSDEYTKIQTELDAIKAEQDSAFKDLNASRDALTKARGVQDEKYKALKELQDNYYAQRRAYQEYDREAARQRAIKRKAEQEKYFLDKKRKDLDRDLEEAGYPAYGEQIRSCDNLIRLLDPASAKKEVSTAPGQFAAAASRTVDASGIKGTALARKNVEDEDNAYFVGGASKKNKKGRKGQRGTASPALGEVTRTDAAPANVDLGRFFEPGVVQQFESVGLTPPSSQEEVAKVVEQLKEKREFWTNDQKRKTQENIAAVQKRIDALMSGAEIDETSTAEPTASANGVSTAGTESDDATLLKLAQEDGSLESAATAPLGEDGKPDEQDAMLKKLADTTINGDAAAVNGTEEP